MDTAIGVSITNYILNENHELLLLPICRCDPFPDADWNGRMLTSRKGDTCVWGEELPKQCFNLGDERKSADNKPLSSEECAKACCSDKECDMWQVIFNYS